MAEDNVGQTGSTTSVASEVEDEDRRFVAGEGFLSRFKMTALLEDRGRIRYGLWEPPEILILGTEPSFTVPPHMEGRIELVSYSFYGTVDLWWAIALVNDILCPIRDLVAGTNLIIPDRGQINDALQRARN